MPIDIAVIGLGYVGLPLAREAVHAGLQVRGFDVTTPIVQALNDGRSHVDDISDSDVAAMVAAGFRATGDVEEIRGTSAVVICVPTPLGPDGGPDLGAVIAATRTVAGILEPGMLVVLESTTYPGTTEEVLKPILEEGGLQAGQDFHLAFSPERIDPGNAVYGMKNTPKVVGGLTPASTERAADLYGRFVDTVVVAKGAREAETAKLLENTYRHINIALVNEMARFCHELDIDLWNVIDLAKTKPFGFQAFYPGPGVGGHCIPIDPNYLSHNVRSRLGYPFRFVELAQEINATMPTYVARRAQDILNEDAKAVRGSRVLLLGVTYKPDIADQRESPAVAVAQNLIAQGADLVFHDPHVEQWRVNGDVLDRVEDLDTAVLGADLVILVQNHSAYDVDALAEKSARFFDTKGASTHEGAVRL
ncbi:nucleotide sugar dehydrogenase [Isoptericola sp. NEAU-Y5]|uniref:Nucleotide sugar dehydrogenase n=1 Tax=Isoptericola luteus TaxID=2879484 RepID=A0ABS7ZCH1_9MICO|nr:nucleotide sugar dehydrogenase [Isoptericola sp. NEAU-Y5]MCA5892725.1 nucleotide sugar dehydrogenase [Isoptericola sp. NEAU-Y5]